MSILKLKFSFMFSWFWNNHKHFDNIWYSNLKTNFVELLPHVWKVIFNALFKFRHLYIQRTSSSFFLSSWLYIPPLSNIFTHTTRKWGRTQIHSYNDYSFRHTLHRYMHTCKVFSVSYKVSCVLLHTCHLMLSDIFMKTFFRYILCKKNIIMHRMYTH